MSNKWVGIAGIIIVVCLVVANLWLEPDSECESLTKENKGKQAFPVCLASAQQGNAYAQNITGVSYMTGDGVQKNANKALNWFHRSANQGFAKAQSNIGLQFLVGDKADRDLTQAVKWWRLAALNGEPHAQYNLAVSYQDGSGVGKNKTLSTKWYLLSSFGYLKQGMIQNSFKSIAQVCLL